MSLTTEHSLEHNRSNSGSMRSFFKRCLCPCLLRKVSPIDQLPHNSEFMTLGKKGKRIICVVHIDPCLRDTVFTLTNASLTAHAKKVVYEDNDSEISSDEYWFTKWTIPLRTVKKFQNQSLPKPNIISFIKNHLPNSPSRNGDNTDTSTVPQLSLEVPQMGETQSEIPSSLPLDGGIINLGFVGSRSDPDAPVTTHSASAIGTVKSQIYVKPLLYFIHGAGESTESWKNIMEYFINLGYEVLALDLIGHGYSYTPKQENCYTFKKILGDVISVFDAHIFNGRKAVVIGHGYGQVLIDQY